MLSAQPPGNTYGLRPVNFSELRSVQDQVDAKLLSLAIRQNLIGQDPSQYVIRDLLPNTDMGASGSIEYFEQQVTAGVYAQPNYSGTNPNDRTFAIYGVRNNAATPRTVAVKFWAETGRTGVLDIWNLDKMNAFGVEADVAWVTANPIFYLANRGYNIDQYGRTGGTDNVVYLGRVVEPINKIIKGAQIQLLKLG